MPKPFWDIEEDKGFISIRCPYDNIYYKVLKNKKNKDKAVLYLANIRRVFQNIIDFLKYNPQMWNNNQHFEGVNILFDIHDRPYNLQEIIDNTTFIGLNKPKKVYKTNKLLKYQDFANKRANYRSVLLKLRTDNGDMLPFNSVLDLAFHEFAHTLCNHVEWRDDDHGPKFQEAEHFLKQIYSQINNI